MGCCGKKNCDRPKEEMTSLAPLLAALEENSWAITKLLEIAKNGIRFVGFKNDHVNELAATIAAVVNENNYLKNLLKLPTTPAPKTDETGMTIWFGPRNEYSLFIAAPTQKSRTALADSLIKAAEELKKTQPNWSEQKSLPFSDCA
jgi:hypothetical protein